MSRRTGETTPSEQLQALREARARYLTLAEAGPSAAGDNSITEAARKDAGRIAVAYEKSIANVLAHLPQDEKRISQSQTAKRIVLGALGASAVIVVLVLARSQSSTLRVVHTMDVAHRSDRVTKALLKPPIEKRFSREVPQSVGPNDHRRPIKADNAFTQFVPVERAKPVSRVRHSYSSRRNGKQSRTPKSILRRRDVDKAGPTTLANETRENRTNKIPPSQTLRQEEVPVTSLEKGASPETVITPLVSIKPTHTMPKYPPYPERVGLTGSTVMNVAVSSTGAAVDCGIIESSGSGILDRVACAHVLKRWLWHPRFENGRPVQSETRVTVVWNLGPR